MPSNDNTLAEAINNYPQAVILDPTLTAVIQEVRRLNDELSKLRADTEAWQRDHAEDNAALGKRVVALEGEEVTESPLVDKLYEAMDLAGKKQVSFSDAARLLKVTPGRISQIKAAIALDDRFEIVRARSHKQKKLIRRKDFKDSSF